MSYLFCVQIVSKFIVDWLTLPMLVTGAETSPSGQVVIKMAQNWRTADIGMKLIRISSMRLFTSPWRLNSETMSRTSATWFTSLTRTSAANLPTSMEMTVSQLSGLPAVMVTGE